VKLRRTPVVMMWLAVAVAAAVLMAEALPARRSHAQPAGFGGVRPAAAPLAPSKTFPPFAQAAGVTLHLPQASPVAVLFHEASSREALAMAPYGRVQRNANRTRFIAPDPPAPGRPYSVMSSRGRGTAGSSAVDIVARAGSTVYSPVTGTVVAVRGYWLYNSFEDIRVEIAPEGHPGIRVVMIHLERVVHIRVGQHVIASQTPIGRPRVLPFHSQTDTYTGTHDPHVHLEIKRVA
jgi:murein DD-endopeptidase MepM/ murein hydrolase activator NlpD